MASRGSGNSRKSAQKGSKRQEKNTRVHSTEVNVTVASKRACIPSRNGENWVAGVSLKEDGPWNRDTGLPRKIYLTVGDAGDGSVKYLDNHFRNLHHKTDMEVVEYVDYDDDDNEMDVESLTLTVSLDIEASDSLNELIETIMTVCVINMNLGVENIPVETLAQMGLTHEDGRYPLPFQAITNDKLEDGALDRIAKSSYFHLIGESDVEVDGDTLNQVNLYVRLNWEFLRVFMNFEKNSAFFNLGRRGKDVSSNDVEAWNSYTRGVFHRTLPFLHPGANDVVKALWDTAVSAMPKLNEKPSGDVKKTLDSCFDVRKSILGTTSQIIKKVDKRWQVDEDTSRVIHRLFRMGVHLAHPKGDELNGGHLMSKLTNIDRQLKASPEFTTKQTLKGKLRNLETLRDNLELLVNEVLVDAQGPEVVETSLVTLDPVEAEADDEDEADVEVVEDEDVDVQRTLSGVSLASA